MAKLLSSVVEIGQRTKPLAPPFPPTSEALVSTTNSGAPWVIAEPPRTRSARERGAPYLRETGKLSIQENLVMTPPYVRTSVGTLRVGVSRNKFLPLSPREFCPLLFQKALEVIDKSESIY